ncbi:MAG: hypothetical protein B6I37_08780 [Desulfobacteraceae bacterium 4572_35.2]|nr:MAG: hypothetical protein B6I37_08780 [Desulfobacteraceae bacterium 4572_35.2]
MPLFTRHIVRSTFPLILMLCVVLAGFSVAHLHHSRFHLFEQQRDQQLTNATALKDLSELIVSDLHQVITYFYRILAPAQSMNSLPSQYITPQQKISHTPHRHVNFAVNWQH